MLYVYETKTSKYLMIMFNYISTIFPTVVLDITYMNESRYGTM